MPAKRKLRIASAIALIDNAIRIKLLFIIYLYRVSDSSGDTPRILANKLFAKPIASLPWKIKASVEATQPKSITSRKNPTPVRL